MACLYGYYWPQIAKAVYKTAFAYILKRVTRHEFRITLLLYNFFLILHNSFFHITVGFGKKEAFIDLRLLFSQFIH